MSKCQVVYSISVSASDGRNIAVNQIKCSRDATPVPVHFTVDNVSGKPVSIDICRIHLDEMNREPSDD